jgi:hypothetical protein
MLCGFGGLIKTPFLAAFDPLAAMMGLHISPAS